MKSFLLTAGIFFLIIGCNAQKNTEWQTNTTEHSLLWKVSGNGLQKPSFLFGTFHMLCKDDIHLSDALKKSIQYVDTVYMEIDMDDPSVLLSGMMYMNMKEGKSLKDLYTESEYARVESYFNDSLKMPMMLFQRAKPALIMSLLYPKMMDCGTLSGMDQEIVKLAKEAGKSVNGLESIELQTSIFDKIPYEWQAKELLNNIDSLWKYKKEFNQMVSLYKDQRLDSLEELMSKNELGGEEFGDILLGSRNRDWVNQLRTIMKKNSVLVAVGAGHLPGTEGVIQLLRKEGYTVTPLKNE